MDFLQTILEDKLKEVADMPEIAVTRQEERPSLYHLIRENPEHIHLIAEIKRASPSKGIINQEVDILKQARDYQEAGVSAISVLTSETYFNGSFTDLNRISQVVDLPILCKDFIIDEKQLIRAYNAGASIVLLIVAALTVQKLKKLYDKARKLGLEVLVEVHNEKELATAEALGAKLIGVNNRDLKTFDVTLETSVALAPYQSETVYISESGFRTAQDVRKISSNFQAILVGETLMKATNVTKKALELQVTRND